MISVLARHLTSEELLARLAHSSGSQPAGGDGQLPFELGARVARTPWLPCKVLHERLSSVRVNSAETVSLVHVGPKFVDGLREISDLPCEDFVRRNNCLRYIAELFLSNMSRHTGWFLQGAPIHIGQSSELVGLSHTTIDARTGKYIGLHLDSWDGPALDDRHQRANRLCVNVGRGDRFLLFIAEPVRAMQERLAQMTRLGVADTEHRARFAQRFLEQFPDEPVFRLRVEPGEAYIAPTENLIHDASSEIAVGQDITVTIRGHFMPLAAGDT